MVLVPDLVDLYSPVIHGIPGFDHFLKSYFEGITQMYQPTMYKNSIISESTSINDKYG